MSPIEASILVFLSIGALPLDAPDERISFVLPVPEEQGGGRLVGRADRVDYERDRQAAIEGDVELKFRDLVLRADRVEVDLETKDLIAAGNVVLDQAGTRLAGSTIRWNLDSQTGVLTDATAVVAPDQFFSGAEIARLSESVYAIKDGVFTACEGEVPPWSFGVREGLVEVDGYARLRGASMRVKSVPVAYLPYVLWPAKAKRSSGFLVPSMGYSERKGGYLGLAYFQTLGPSYDTTLYADLYSEGFYGLGDEFRYQPSENSRGGFRGHAIQDTDDGEWRWKAEYFHETKDILGGFRGVVSYEDYSDFEFFREFERSLNDTTRAFVYSNGYLSGNWGSNSLNLLVDDRQTFSGDNVITLRQLPEVEYSLRSTQLGSLPLYAEMNARAHYFSVERTEVYQGEYGRGDLFPRLRAPLSPAPWLRITVAGGARYTWWSDSIGRVVGNQRGFIGETLDRFLPTASAEVVGPSFSRVYERPIGNFSKFKHIIEPQYDYLYVGDFDDQSLVPLFDEVDQVRTQNVVRVALVNRVLAKPKDPEEGEAPPPGSVPGGVMAVATSAREIFSFEIARGFSLDEDSPLEQGQVDGETIESKSGPLQISLRSYPSDRFGLTLDTFYSMLFDNVTSVRLNGNFSWGEIPKGLKTYGGESLSSIGGWNWGPTSPYAYAQQQRLLSTAPIAGTPAHRIDFSWFPRFQTETGETLANQVTMGLRLGLLPGRLHLRSNVTYDVDGQEIRDQRHFVNYYGGCFAVRLEYHESRTTELLRQTYLIAVDLKNVGSFLDMSGGSSEDF